MPDTGDELRKTQNEKKSMLQQNCADDIAQPVDHDFMEGILTKYESQIKRYAYGYAGYLGKDAVDDAISYITLNLIKVIHDPGYDPDRGVPFDAWIKYQIKLAALAWLKERVGLKGRSKYDFLKSLTKLLSELYNVIDEDCSKNHLDKVKQSLDEMAVQLKEKAKKAINIERKNVYLDVALKLEELPISKDTSDLLEGIIKDLPTLYDRAIRESEGEGDSFDTYFNELPSKELPKELLLKAERYSIYMEAIATLPEKEKIIIVALTYKGMTLKQIGEEILDLTESRIGQLYKKARVKMLYHFDKNDFKGLD